MITAIEAVILAVSLAELRINTLIERVVRAYGPEPRLIY
jgi:hypothetical protein